MNKVSISKPCRKCGRSSTYVKKTLGRKGEHYVCVNCGYKLCKASEIMQYAFPAEEKPMGNTSRLHTQGKKRRESKRKDSKT